MYTIEESNQSYMLLDIFPELLCTGWTLKIKVEALKLRNNKSGKNVIDMCCLLIDGRNWFDLKVQIGSVNSF